MSKPIPRVSITIEFELPGGDQPNPHSLLECAGLVLKQMKVAPVWSEPSGTGLLNYVCHDRTMRITEARIIEAP